MNQERRPSRLKPDPTLQELQSWLRWIITDPRGVHDALEDPHSSKIKNEPVRFKPRHPENYLKRYTAPKPQCLHAIEATATLPQVDRLTIYAEAYFSRLSGSLSDDFSSIERLVGKEAFLQLSNDYLKEYPSKSESLADLGHQFSQFLSQHDVSVQLPYVVDVAKLEWLRIEAFYAADLPKVTPEEIQAIPEEKWPEVRFTVDPSLRLMTSFWNIEAALSSGPQNFYPEKQTHSRYLRVLRVDGEISHSVLSAEEYLACQLLSSNHSLGEICTKLEKSGAMTDSQIAESIQSWFAEWIHSGLIRKVTHLKP